MDNTLKPLLRLSLDSKLNITPQLQQAIQLLNLSANELQAKIDSMLESNPMLELQESNATEEKMAEHYTSTWSSSYSIEALSEKPLSLQHYLLWQMELAPFSEEDKLIATILIDAINEDGFLNCSLDEIMNTLQPELQVEKDEILAVLHRIQHFDPIGCGARDLAECLKLQIEQLPAECPWRAKALILVNSYLPTLAKRDYATLQRRLDLKYDELEEVIHGIKSLKPRPQMRFAQQTLDTRSPDVYTYKNEQSWCVELSPVCRLTINESYADLIKNKKVDNQDLKKQLQEARWFLSSLEKRNQTLLKVTEAIVNLQKDFLEQGESAMKPLIAKEIANRVNLHASTISRITTNKYIATPRGTFPLKYFFSSATLGVQGESCSQIAIRALIKKLVSKENPLKPLSDNKLTSLLQTRGISLARRTVAKYRELLMIPSSEKRKQLI